MRLTLVTRRGLADLIREKFGVKLSLLIFGALVVANLGTITVNVAAMKTTSAMLHLPAIPFMLFIVGNFFPVCDQRELQTYPGDHAALQSLLPDIHHLGGKSPTRIGGWHFQIWFIRMALSLPRSTCSNYLFIGMGVIGTTITPWGQFFISSFCL